MNKNETPKPPEVLISDPRSPLFAPLANLYLEDGMVDEAIQLCLSGLGNYPDSLDGHLVLGKAYLKKGDLELARDELKMVLSLDQGHEEAMKSLSDLEEKAVAPADPLVEALAELRGIEGVLGVLLLEEGGSVVGQNLGADLEVERITGLLASLFSKARTTLLDIHLGNLETVTAEMGHWRIFLFRLRRRILALLTERSTTMGLVMLEMRRLLPKLQRTLPQA